MKWKAKYTEVHYPNGASRLKRIFAWSPVYIDGTMLWLETYEVLQMYVLNTHKVILDPTSKETTNFHTGVWIDISKRFIK